MLRTACLGQDICRTRFPHLDCFLAACVHRRTALACAVESGSTETVAALLRAGFENAHAKSSLDITRHSGDPRMSPVYLALARSDTGALEAIIKAATVSSFSC